MAYKQAHFPLPDGTSAAKIIAKFAQVSLLEGYCLFLLVTRGVLQKRKLHVTYAVITYRTW